MPINEEFLHVLKKDLTDAFAAVGAKHNVSLQLRSGKYDELGATYTLEISTIEAGKVITKEMANLRLLKDSLGLTQAHLDQVFTLGGRSFRLYGYKNTGGAKPFLVEDQNNKMIYLLTREQLYGGLNIQ